MTVEDAPAQFMLLAWGIGGAVASLIAGRKLPGALFITVAAPFLYFFMLYRDLGDALTGQSLAAEAGDSYAAVFYVSALVFALGATIGIKMALRQLRRR